MGKPVVVDIPHQLGREEAIRRLQNGFSSLRSSFGHKFAVLQDDWSGDHLDFQASLLGQETKGFLDVADDHVHLEVELPWMLAMLANKAKDLVRREGRLMLEKPAPKKA